jgi:hypothetical protein
MSDAMTPRVDTAALDRAVRCILHDRYARLWALNNNQSRYMRHYVMKWIVARYHHELTDQ